MPVDMEYTVFSKCFYSALGEEQLQGRLLVTRFDLLDINCGHLCRQGCFSVSEAWLEQKCSFLNHHFHIQLGVAMSSPVGSFKYQNNVAETEHLTISSDSNPNPPSFRTPNIRILMDQITGYLIEYRFHTDTECSVPEHPQG